METSARRLDWPIIGWLSSVHLVALGTLAYAFFVEQFAWQTYVLSACLFLVYQLTVSDGMHLSGSHRAFRVSKGMQLYFRITSAGAVQGPDEVW